MWLKEVSDTFRLSVFERATSPLLGAFSFIWVAFNWEAVLILLFQTDWSITQRLGYLKDPSLHYASSSSLYWFPLLFTFLFIVAYPFVAAGAYWVWQLGARLKEKFAEKFDSERMLSLEDALRLKREIRELRYRHEEELEKKDLAFETLTQELGLLNKSLSDRDGELKSSRADVDSKNEQINQFMSANEGLNAQLRDEQEKTFDLGERLQEFKAKATNIDDVRRISNVYYDLVSSMSAEQHVRCFGEKAPIIAELLEVTHPDNVKASGFPITEFDKLVKRLDEAPQRLGLLGSHLADLSKK